MERLKLLRAMLSELHIQTMKGANDYNWFTEWFTEFESALSEAEEDSRNCDLFINEANIGW